MLAQLFIPSQQLKSLSFFQAFFSQLQKLLSQLRGLFFISFLFILYQAMIPFVAGIARKDIKKQQSLRTDRPVKIPETF